MKDSSIFAGIDPDRCQVQRPLIQLGTASPLLPLKSNRDGTNPTQISNFP